MRRLRNEEGFALVLVAVVLVLLMVAAGFAVDLGAMYQERRELRNGADAAALAIAEVCAISPTDPECSNATGDGSPADTYADLNAHDEHAAVDQVTICGPGWPCTPTSPYTWTVRTVTSAEDEGGDPGFPMKFMRIVGVDTLGVRAAATAAAGPLGSAETPPVVFEACEWAKAFAGAPGSYPTPDVTLFLHQSPLPSELPACPTFLGPAGKDAPGAFGYLDSTGQCSALITSGLAYTDVGNKPPQPDCKPEDIYRVLIGEVGADGYGQIIPIPIFSAIQDEGTGNNVVYEILGLAAFQTKRYNLGGQFCYPGTASDCEPCPDNPDTPTEDHNHTCIIGRFVEAELQGLGEFGDVDLGAILIRLID